MAILTDQEVTDLLLAGMVRVQFHQEAPSLLLRAPSFQSPLLHSLSSSPFPSHYPYLPPLRVFSHCVRILHEVVTCEELTFSTFPLSCESSS